MAKKKATTSPATSGRTVHDIPIGQILLDPNQPRTEFDPKKLAELALSIKTEGLQQFPTVTLAHKENGVQYYYVKAGERRYHAHKLLARAFITCVVLGEERYSGALEVDRILAQAAENSSREPHTHAEIIRVFRLVLDDVKEKMRKANEGSDRGAVQIAKKRMASAFGKTEGWATNYYQLLFLDASLVPCLDDEDNRLGFNTAISLARAPVATQFSLKEQAARVEERHGKEAANRFIVRQANAFRTEYAKATGARVRVRSHKDEIELLLGMVRRQNNLAYAMIADEHSSEFANRIERLVGGMDVSEVDEALSQMSFARVTFAQLEATLRKRREVLYADLKYKAA